MASNLERITVAMDKARNGLAVYQFLTAFPQIASRLGHKNGKMRQILVKILGNVIKEYPRQAIWPMFGLMNSSRKERKEQCKEVMGRVMVRQGIYLHWVPEDPLMSRR
jgi:serine/threonine-protein kinase ATR